ncbi:hypothetical protein G4B88_001668 [Cannabis sativa]|uniref:E3 ubiquitin-protein ligase APD1-4 middle domain-containing protein n=1 Tax=Cannabis sativa TaxID=3483 RepID=A0A7J6I1P3_CANSA|nr:hypothetical protein G4B88_001668 [Cannabis sativa]
MISQGISKSSSYYVAAGNLNSEDVEVKLKIRIRASQYDTSEAYYKCNISEGPCSMQILFPEGNAAVLTNLGPDQVAAGPKLYVKLTYGPRWATYIVGIGSMTMLMLFLFNFLDKCHSTRDGTGGHNEVIQPERHPLLSNKDDDLSSWGSSYESVSQDEEDLAIGSIEGKSIEDGENSNNTRRLCAICFDAPRDCFFLPCGHCVACFECGTRIAYNIEGFVLVSVNFVNNFHMAPTPLIAGPINEFRIDIRGRRHMPNMSPEDEEGEEDFYCLKHYTDTAIFEGDVLTCLVLLTFFPDKL